jgi:hypothetical protein
VPIVVGDTQAALCQRIGEALGKVLTGRSALIVASSDLSHYPRAQDAEEVDRRTLMTIATLDAGAVQATLQKALRENRSALDTAACGEAPILVALAAAKALGARRAVPVSYAHSGHALVGESGRVVGYGAVACTAAAGPLGEIVTPGAAANSEPITAADKERLLAFARETVRRALFTETVPLPRGFPPRLMRPQGLFVTLKKNGALRGCIGHVTATEALGKLVGAMALAAAFGDRRFAPVVSQEYDALAVEISLLSPPGRVAGPEAIVVGRDGVILEKAGKTALFLPQVAPEQGWGREEMLDNLCEKAGLARGCWRQGASFSTFQADVFHEERGARRP